MRRRAGGLLVLALLPACGQRAEGGLRALTAYEVTAVADDQASVDGPGFARSLDFTFASSSDSTSREQCGSLAGARVTFAGRPVTGFVPGGWMARAQACDLPSVDVPLDEAAVEPQNGVLAIDGDGEHFEVPFQHPFGTPEVKLVSAGFYEIVVDLKGFAKLPPIGEIAATLWAAAPGGEEKATPLPNDTLSADGQLAIAVPRGTIGGPMSAILSLSFHLGDEKPACVGFSGCAASSYVLRTLPVDLPAP